MFRLSHFSLACMMALSAGSSDALARSIGVAAAVNQSARVVPPGGGGRTLTLGDNVIFNEKIETNDVGLLQILLADGTTFTVGPNSSLTIDRFVYDPDAGTAQVAATFTKGVFRFIGGKTSKTPGGATINTPVGTIGIRGGIATGSYQAGQNGGAAELNLSLGYGKVDLKTTDGKVYKLYTPGFSIKLSQSNGGAQRASVEKTTGDPNAGLTPKPNTSGGTTNPPKSEDVAKSGVDNTNSSYSTSSNAPPNTSPQTQTQTTTAKAEQTVSDASKGIVRDTVVEADAVQYTGGPKRLRVLTAGTTYESFDTVSNPGAVGLLGGSADHDQSLTGTLSADGTRVRISTAQGILIVPVYTDSSFAVHTITAADGFTLDGSPLSGKIYSGVDGFAAYALTIGGDSSNPIFAVTGTPLTDLSVLADGDVRTYSFTPDLLQNIAVPFVRAGALNTNYSTAAISDFYVIEPSSLNSGDPRLFQASLLISGTGAAQISGIAVNVGALYEDDGVMQFGFGRRGSGRSASDEYASTLFGGISTLGDGSDGNEIFGSNGQNFVLNYNSDENDAFNDSPGDWSTPVTFGTSHVLNLTDETSVGDFVGDNDSTRNLASTGVIRGFAAGIEEGVNTTNSYLFKETSGSDPDNVYMAFDGSSNSFGGEIYVGISTTSIAVAFGNGVRGNTEYGASTYIDDNTFGAADNNSHTRTNGKDYDSEGDVLTNYFPLPGFSSNTYVVSGDAVPQTSILPEGKLCSCEFLEWGWWGTQLNASTDPNATEADIRSTVHLGTWVAGDITTNAEIAPLTGTATYEGNALGNVYTSVSGSDVTYIASGDMNMNWDFGAHTGSMNISNFDGRNFSGALNATSGTVDALFSGGLTGNAGVSGTVNGAFVNDGTSVAQGVIGNFSLSNGDSSWAAVGIIGGGTGSE